MNEALAKVGLVALIFLAGFIGGLKLQEWRFDAKERATLVQKIETERAAAKKARQDADDVGSKLAAAEQRATEERINFNRRLKDERTRGTSLVVGCQGTTEAPGRQPLGDAGMASGPGGDGPMLTGDFVRLWNDALIRAGATGSDPGSPDGKAEATGPASPWEALENLGENASRWKECRSVVDGWQDLARRRGWVSGATP